MATAAVPAETMLPLQCLARLLSAASLRVDDVGIEDLQLVDPLVRLGLLALSQPELAPGVRDMLFVRTPAGGKLQRLLTQLIKEE